MSIAIRSGASVVEASGSVTTFGGQPLIFEVGRKRLQRVELIFETDASDTAVSVKSEELEDGYRLRLTNFDGTEGRGSAQPVLLGEDGEELMFFHFRVMRFGATEDRTVFYTFYRARKEDVGWKPLVEGEASG